MVFRALADLFLVHEIPTTPTWRLRASLLFPSGDVGRLQQHHNSRPIDLDREQDPVEAVEIEVMKRN